MMTNFTDREQVLINEAISWAKAHKKEIAKEFTDKAVFPPDNEPVAFFMAGCPGAGKTELSRAMKRSLDNGRKVGENGAFTLIDPDEIRARLPGYNGANAHLFQYPTSILVDAIFDKLMANKQSFILDGTLSDLAKARSNIERCLRKSRNYVVLVTFVYNEPLNAWKFAKARELVDGRAITIDVFVDRYFASKESVRKLKKEFGQNISLDLLFKDLETKSRPEFNISDIDSYLDEKYTPESLKQALLELEKDNADS